MTALVTSPLTQSAVAYPTRLVPGTGTATTATSDVYPPRGLVAAGSDLDVRQKQAIHQGLFNPANETVPGVAPRCSSGECRWEPVSSLAVCVAAADVSDRLNVTQVWNWNLAAQLGLPPQQALNNASLPNGVFLVGGGGDSYNLNISAPRADGSAPGDSTIAFADRAGLRAAAIADIFVVYTNQTGGAASGPVGFRAVEMLLHFCVATYREAVIGGEHTAEQTESETGIPTANGTLGGQQLVLGTGTGDPSRRYAVDLAYAEKLGRYVASTFAGTYSASFGARATGYTTTSDAFGTAVYSGAVDGGSTTLGGEASRDSIFNVTNNVALSLTNA